MQCAPGLFVLHGGDPADVSLSPSAAAPGMAESGAPPGAVFACLPAGSPATLHPRTFSLFPLGRLTLGALGERTPATPSLAPRSPAPAGVFSASKQRQVQLAGPADGAYATGAQVPPPSPGAHGASRPGRRTATSWVTGGRRAGFWGLGSRSLWEGSLGPGTRLWGQQKRKKLLAGQASLKGPPGGE